VGSDFPLNKRLGFFFFLFFSFFFLFLSLGTSTTCRAGNDVHAMPVVGA